MTKPLFLPLPGNEALAAALANAAGGEVGAIEYRRFPDGESYIRLVSDVRQRPVALVCSLARPDEKTMPLIFAATTARELGAAQVGLIAPYLAYMRQDKRFNAGEAVTSVHYARLLSSAVDWLVTVDPHLHRYAGLDEIYTVPTRVVHAAPRLAAWIRSNIDRPLIVGPDEESEQWVAAVAAQAGAPHVTLTKQRFGDRDVRIRAPELSQWSDRQPVLIDDIVSSGRTIAAAAQLLREAGLPRPTCVAVHALLDGEAGAALETAVDRLITTNSVAHPTNAIDLAPLVAQAAAEMVEKACRDLGPAL